MSIIQTLTEGMVNRNMQREGAALLNKWSQTGLLEGLSNDEQRSGMARLLENQARELLRESNTMAGGDVEGFAAVAFPIVRRVFAGLIANDLVSVQPMSLPSGLIFFLDFKFGDPSDGSGYDRLGASSEDSIYGQGIVGSQVTGGVQLNNETLDKQPYAFGSAFSSPTGSIATDKLIATVDTTYDGFSAAATIANPAFEAKGAEFDPDLCYSGLFDGKKLLKVTVATTTLEAAGISEINMKTLSSIILPLNTVYDGTSAKDQSGATQIRRLTRVSSDEQTLTFVYLLDDANALVAAAEVNAGSKFGAGSYAMIDQLKAQGGLGAIAGTNNWGLEGEENIPEIDIKVDSIAITAVTKKLKAKWTPELGQDLNAYHNLDAEVELTSILSEQIALEIDREILQDLIRGATAGTFYWSRSPGMFVNRETGAEIGANTAAPDFTGTVSEWYETLIETINDVSAQIHRKTLRGGANFCVVSPEVANILEFTAGFRANVTADADKGDIGAVKVGSLNRKFDVIVDPYFPRNAVLVGRKGSSFLESGYVYAPYVPLQTTPTIFGPEDFVPRKGVMTRYGKKMVRPDMYGLVIVRGLTGESGAAAS
jgi:hypothetical protein